MTKKLTIKEDPEYTENALKVIELKHKYRMIELEYERENNRLFHEQQLTVIRIKSAEIKRTQQRRDFERYGGTH